MDIARNMWCFGKIHCHELFPTKWSGFIFVAYMVLFVNQGILVTASQRIDNSYNYSTTAAVLATELFKLITSIFFYGRDNDVMCLVKDSRPHLKVMLKYFIPAFLYCFYNNLAFVNLSTFDPTTYYLMLQLRVVFTGILFQILFNRELSTKQWLSLGVLTAGCMIKHLTFSEALTPTDSPVIDTGVLIKPIHKSNTPFFSVSMLLIIVQVFCSCLAGVYNEFLLKSTDTEHCNIYIQNVFMYLDSIVCNVALLIWQGELNVLWDTAALKQLYHIEVMSVIVNNALIGIVTSFFLKSLNSILKTFASALELIFTALMTYAIFGIPIYLNTLCAIIVVVIAVIMYSQNPVVNVKPTKDVSLV